MIRVRWSLKRAAGSLEPAGLKTESSKRTFGMPLAVRSALTALRKEQAADKCASASTTWTGTIWCSATTPDGPCPASG